MITVTVGKRGQVTLPRAIRQRAGIQDGDRVAVSLEGDRIVMLPLGKTLLDLRGSIPVADWQDFEHIRQEVLRRRAQKAADHEA